MKANLLVALLAVLALPLTAAAHGPQGESPRVRERDGLYCPAGMARWSPEQAMESRLSAIAAGDWDLFFCSYDVDVKVVTPGAVTEGRLAVRDQFLGLFGLLGGQIPTVTSLTFADGVVLLTHYIHTPFISIADGADTFVIKHGRIRYQTVHGTLTFNMP